MSNLSHTPYSRFTIFFRPYWTPLTTTCVGFCINVNDKLPVVLFQVGTVTAPLKKRLSERKNVTTEENKEQKKWAYN